MIFYGAFIFRDVFAQSSHHTRSSYLFAFRQSVRLTVNEVHEHILVDTPFGQCDICVV